MRRNRRTKQTKDTKQTKEHRGPNRFRRREVARLARAVQDVGLAVDKIQIDPDGRITLTPVRRDAAAQPDNDLDKWIAKRHADTAPRTE